MAVYHPITVKCAPMPAMPTAPAEKKEWETIIRPTNSPDDK